MKDPSFQATLKSLNSSAYAYLIKYGDTVQDWIEDEFIKANRMVQEVLIKAISKIHISCNLWTSLNRYAMCGVTAYFVSYQG